jgi:drug/metabolite transporter (DMT)-like permease
MSLVALMLWPIVLMTGAVQQLSLSQCAVLAASGLVGIFIGDTALFATLNRLGPRRTGVLFATHAVFSAACGYWLFDEHLGLQALAGGVLVLAGVMMAIALGRRKDETHAWEANRGSFGTGVALGLLAALCQALGSVIAKPVMLTGVDPLAATAVRVSATCLAQFALLWSGFASARSIHKPTLKTLAHVGLIGFIGMGLGMTMILQALRYGEVGMVAILSSVTPVLVLPLLWYQLGRAPAVGAWMGAAFTVMGTALVLLRA